MGSLAALTTTEVIDRVLGSGAVGHAEVRDALVAVDAAAWAATSPRVLELCRVRVAMLLGCDVETTARTPGVDIADDVIEALAAWPSDPRFDDVDRACLALTEMFVIDVASIDDATVDAVREHLGDVGVQSFVRSLLVVEQRIRLRLVWNRLLGGD